MFTVWCRKCAEGLKSILCNLSSHFKLQTVQTDFLICKSFHFKSFKCFHFPTVRLGLNERLTGLWMVNHTKYVSNIFTFFLCSRCFLNLKVFVDITYSVRRYHKTNIIMSSTEIWLFLNIFVKHEICLLQNSFLVLQLSELLSKK